MRPPCCVLKCSWALTEGSFSRFVHALHTPFPPSARPQLAPAVQAPPRSSSFVPPPLLSPASRALLGAPGMALKQ